MLDAKSYCVFVCLFVCSSVGVCAQTYNYIPQKCNILTIVPCVCQDERGNFVDLRSLGKIGYGPAFKDQHTAGLDDFLYSYNPCFGFGEGSANSTCTTKDETAVCKVSENRTTFENVGSQKYTSFGHFDNGNLSLVYRSYDNTSTTIVSLYCDVKVDPAGYRVVGEMDKNVYWLQIRSKHCCPVAPTEELYDLARQEMKVNPNFTIMVTDGDFTHVIEASTTPSPVPIPTMPTPSSHTMTSAPGPSPGLLDKLDSILIVLYGILIVVSFIFGVMLAGKIASVQCAKNSPPRYSRLPYLPDGSHMTKTNDVYHI